MKKKTQSSTTDEMTMIGVTKEVRKAIKDQNSYPKESYDEILRRTFNLPSRMEEAQ